MSKIQPLGKRVVAEPIEASDKTSSGFYLPADAKESPKLAKVVAVGEGVSKVKVGDTILHQEYGTTKYDGKEYVIAKVKDILAVIK